jgi:CRP-like cAMP-binding protein
MVSVTESRRNSLLAALPGDELARLSPGLKDASLELGKSIYESGTKINFLYFPTDCVISLLHVLENGDSSELAVVGREGVVGVSLFMGGITTPSRAVVQSAGHALMMEANVLHKQFERGGALQLLLLRYTQALITQMAQTAVCNRHHDVEQQFARWLLLSFDRLDGDVLRMTQQLIADMLGVRRAGVTEAARKLQDAGVIEYTRGRIRILDRPALEKAVCECYFVVRDEYQRLLAA